MVLALATACSAPVEEDVGLPPLPPGFESTTTLAPATTTTQPVPADVADLAATTTMTERARRLFVAAEPAIEDPTTFARNCGIDDPVDTPGQARTHTQGCYVAGRIHLLAPDRAEGRDLLYVVAAHELLHAVYAELRPAERARIDAELDAARAGNERLEERLRPYASSPTLQNEIHSILGSEFSGLSPALEAHYAQFFADRSAVVAARQRTLGTREDAIRRLKAEVDDLDNRITALKADQDSLRAAGDFRSFNAYVGVVNGLIDRYNASIVELNAQIEEYNGLLGG
ncbi:MAG TPA: hypothetical protein VJ653_03395 [Acidimicrobiales bacterium]|nr:hypothetical protein [Acidimicrobiales bacterium]